MGVNASILGLTHYEDIPVEILRSVVAEMRKPVDDGSSWPLLSQVCKDWRRAAGTCLRECVCKRAGVHPFDLCRRDRDHLEDGLSGQGVGQPGAVLAVPPASTAECFWASQL